MRKLVVSHFVSLDGVMEAPATWSLKYHNDEIDAVKHDELFAADALLLGRATCEIFADAWPHMTDDSGFADRMNGIATYVTSVTPRDPEWSNTIVLAGAIGDEVKKLKALERQDTLLAGSAHPMNGLLRSSHACGRRGGDVETTTQHRERHVLRRKPPELQGRAEPAARP